MELTKSDVAKFQKLYKEKFNQDLDYQTAYQKLSKLVRQVEIVYQPITKKQLDELVVRDKRKEDAEALAKLLYDMYKDKKRKEL